MSAQSQQRGEVPNSAGPWIAEEVGVTDMGPNGVAVFEIRSADGYERICEYVSAKHAPLIAAAPDMLAALRDMVDALDCRRAGMINAFEDGYVERARAAIALATGSDSSTSEGR
jgi:hypothetical protein